MLSRKISVRFAVVYGLLWWPAIRSATRPADEEGAPATTEEAEAVDVADEESRRRRQGGGSRGRSPNGRSTSGRSRTEAYDNERPQQDRDGQDCRSMRHKRSQYIG